MFYIYGMRFIRNILLLTAAVAVPFFAGCSVDLTHSDLEGVPLTTEKFSFFGSIPVVVNGDSVEMSQDLLRAYTAAADAEAFPREHCRGVAAVQAQVQQNAPASAWGLGATIIPFWPALPVDETWTYTLSARIFCDGTLVKRVEFTEESRVQAFWYGMLRSDLLNAASSEMHKKLVQRLSFELRNRQADLNSASDY